ncbi:MAG TPA: LysM domain-containing protein [Acidimicrobiales bacterium]|nr:LysM domain-containing protein [Acidimicrobiales bacterium]
MFTSRGFRIAGAGALLGAEVVALYSTTTLDGFAVPLSDVPGWLAETRTEDVLVAAALLAARGVALWLLASTALYLAAGALRLPRLARAIGWTTLPAFRRLIDGMVAGSVVAGTMVGTAIPAAAQAAEVVGEHTYVPRPAGDGPAYTPIPAGSGRPALAPPTTAPLDEPMRFPASTPAPAPTTGGFHRVEPGEHLWGIARAHLAAAGGRPAEDLRPADVAPYWRRLIDANTGRLRSGDPDLIHPGEELVLPDVDEGVDEGR